MRTGEGSAYFSFLELESYKKEIDLMSTRILIHIYLLIVLRDRFTCQKYYLVILRIFVI